MGAALFVVLDPETTDVDVSMDGKALARHADRLGELAASFAVRDLWSFHSEAVDDVAAFLSGEAEISSDTETLELPNIEATAWFEPKAGLRTVETLLALLEANPGAVPESAEVMIDLESLDRILRAAEACGARWRLAVDS